MRLEEAKAVYNTESSKPRPHVDTNLPPNFKKAIEAEQTQVKQQLTKNNS